MRAMFAGSFDPFTVGHKEIADRALRIFGSLVIAVGRNGAKQSLLPADERVASIASVYKDNPEVEVCSYTGLTADFARKCGAGILVRGIRNASDFDYEKNLADANRIVLGIDTVFLPAAPEYAFISSSMVRELIHHGIDASNYIARNDSGLTPTQEQ